MKKLKGETVTFKVDQPLAEALKTIPNRSEFIRGAVAAALEGVCPLCQGSGTLTMDQKRHWDSFARRHQLARCDQCHAVHLTCHDGQAQHSDGGTH